MGLLRLLLLAAIGWFIWRLLLRASIPAQPPPSRTGKEEYLPLTQCTICGVHIPRPPDGRAPICERCRTAQ
jgi:hypothetical protein